MKRILIILFLFIDIGIIFIYCYLDSNYKKKNELLLNKLDNSSYENKIDNLNSQYDNFIKNISIISNYEIEDINSLDNVISELNTKHDNLVDMNSQLLSKKEQLSKQKKNLNAAYNKLLEEEIKKSTFMISGVPKINQYSLGYPTGCESAALTNLLNYWEVSVSMSSVVRVLPKGDLPYYENNIRYGGNPYLEFVGTPSSWSSYGVYEKPILKVAESFKSGVINGTGMSLNDVLKIVRENRPVIVWVSMNMAVPYISSSWYYKPTGEKISWMSNEHALVVIGYNQNQVIVSDSLNGSVRYYDRDIFENRYNVFGKRAVYY